MKDEINIDGVIYVKKEVVKDKEWHRKYSEGFLEYDSGDWEYADDEDIYHLIRDGKEIAKGKRAWSYSNGDWAYMDGKNIWHLIRNGKEIASGRFVYSYNNGDWEYVDGKGIKHTCQMIND